MKRIVFCLVLIAPFLVAQTPADAGKFVSVVSKPKEVQAGAGPVSQKAKCPAGTTVVGGGFLVSGDHLAKVVASVPYDGKDQDKKTDDGWKATAESVSAVSRTLMTYAMCAKNLKVRYRTADALASAAITGLSIPCLEGEEVVGGGGSIEGDHASLEMAGTQPIDGPDPSPDPGEGWMVTFNNDSGVSQPMRGVAVCTKQGSYEHAGGVSLTNANAESSGAAGNPGSIVGGGCRFDAPPTTAVYLLESRPFSDGTSWWCTGGNTSGGNATMRIFSVNEAT